MKKVAVYTRFNGGCKTENCNLDFQEKQYYKFCEKNNHQSSKDLIYREVVISGLKQSRPQLDKLLEDAKKKKFDMLVIYKFSRLARSQKVFLNIESRLRGYGVVLRSMTENFDTTTTMGEYAMRNMIAIAEFEKRQEKERRLIKQ